MNNSCYQCHGKYGLVSYRMSCHKFCSRKCLEQFKERQEWFRQWTEFFSTRRSTNSIPPD